MPEVPGPSGTAARVFWRGLGPGLSMRVCALWLTLLIIYQVFHYAIALELRGQQLTTQSPLAHALTWACGLVGWALLSGSSLRALLYTRHHTLLWLWRMPLTRRQWSGLVSGVLVVWNAPLVIPALLVRDGATAAVVLTVLSLAAPMCVVVAGRGVRRVMPLLVMAGVVGCVAALGQWHRELWWVSCVVCVPVSVGVMGWLYESLRGQPTPGVQGHILHVQKWMWRGPVSALWWRDLSLSWRMSPGIFAMVVAVLLPCLGLSFAMWRHGHALDFMAWLTCVCLSVPVGYMGRALRERLGDHTFYNGGWGITATERFFAWQGMMCVPMVLYGVMLMPLWWSASSALSWWTWPWLVLLQVTLGSVHGVMMCASEDRVVMRMLFALPGLALLGWSFHVVSVLILGAVCVGCVMWFLNRLEALRDG